MKKILFIIAFIFYFSSFGQVGVTDLGKKSFSQVRNSFTITACEVTKDKVLTYCVEDGSRFSFLFKERILNGIMTMTAFSTQYSAEMELERVISREKSTIGIEPFISNGKTMFNTLESPIFISYYVESFNQTYYMIHYIGAK
tara:strand:+ start:404 stop:829 length:426 start_codon:yes stop_codon:yes gene_type:complete